MVEEPRISHEPDGGYIVWDISLRRPRLDTRFLGWLLLGATAGIVLYDIRAWKVASTWEYLLPLSSALVGVLLVRFAARPQRFERALLRLGPLRTIELGEGELRRNVMRPSSLELCSAQGPRAVPIEELTHVVFGLIDVPWPGREGVQVEAFALYFALRDGTPLPIIDGTTQRIEAFRIGEQLSGLLGIPLITLGKGA
ncbi:MAG: hypothetical protein RBU37_21125 [Myxococcota bacterium]|jgi:hypothetical protein|nr:hypothetical protein [Myxococcota bacterium]